MKIIERHLELDVLVEGDDIFRLTSTTGGVNKPTRLQATAYSEPARTNPLQVQVQQEHWIVIPSYAKRVEGTWENPDSLILNINGLFGALQRHSKEKPYNKNIIGDRYDGEHVARVYFEGKFGGGRISEKVELPNDVKDIFTRLFHEVAQ